MSRLLLSEMDFSKITQQDKEEEVRVKTLLELSSKKYNMQKELEGLTVKLVVKQSELEKLQKKVVALNAEVPVLEKQEEIAKKTARDVLELFLVKSEEIEKIQESVWSKINGFVAEANGTLANSRKKTPAKNPGNQREDRIRQLKVEAEIEAMRSYQKYQSAKTEELKLIKDHIEKDSFVI